MAALAIVRRARETLVLPVGRPETGGGLKHKEGGQEIGKSF